MDDELQKEVNHLLDKAANWGPVGRCRGSEDLNSLVEWYPELATPELMKKVMATMPMESDGMALDNKICVVQAILNKAPGLLAEFEKIADEMKLSACIRENVVRLATNKLALRDYHQHINEVKAKKLMKPAADGTKPNGGGLPPTQKNVR